MQLGREIREGFAQDLENEAARKIIRTVEKWREGGKIKSAQRRYLFELIQNALDVNRERGSPPIRIEIIYQDNKFIFRHNAGYFTPKEIRALIYAYSTKPYERTTEEAGKFATGFLVTHILSKKVNIKGNLKRDGEFYQFNTIIDRESSKIDDIVKSFIRSFNDLDSAIKLEDKPQYYWTEYIYEITDEIGRNAISIGVDEIRKCLICLFAFNNIEEIKINNDIYKKKLLTKETIEVGGTEIRLRKGQNIEIGMIINSHTKEIQNLNDAPRIYVKGLPLVETGSYITLPFVIHSKKFDIPEDRDTLKNIDDNKELLRRSTELFYALLMEVNNKDLKGLYKIMDIDLISEERISQNPLWEQFNEDIKEIFRQIIESVPLVNTLDGKKAVKEVIFPLNRLNGEVLSNKLFEKFYEVTSQIKKNIPTKDEINKWIPIMEKLKGIDDFSDLILLYGIKDMKNEFVEFVKKKSFSNLEDFSEKYGLEDSKQFLLSFFEILNELYKKEIISSPFIDYLLPDQTGIVGPCSWNGGQLHIDNNIPDDLKDIAHKIGWEIRQELLDKDFVNYEIVKDFVRSGMDTDGALDKLIKDENLKPKEDNIRKEEWNDNILGWIELLRWCVRLKKLKKGIPIILKGKKIRNVEELDEESFIIPFKYANIDEKYEDIFPENRIIHNKYFDLENPQEVVEGLKNYKTFVTSLPLYKNDLTLEYNKLKSILKEEYQISKVAHSMRTEEDSISFFPFLEQEVEGRVSQSQERGKLLFKFVVEYLITQDDSWKRSIRIRCSCRDKEHEIIPSQWLASLKSDTWVPFKVIDDEEEKIVKREASKESIENLFPPDELEELIKANSDKICELLPHFGFDELDLKIKLRSIEKGKPEEVMRREVSTLVDLTDIVPDITNIVSQDLDAFKEAIEKLRVKLEKEPFRIENRTIGENLEKIIRDIIEKEGLKVRSIYRGGDLEIWPEDGDGWDSGQIAIGHYLLEIKFTSGSRVHLSKTQSDMARNWEEGYIVLVVENVDNLRDYLKDIDEGSIPEEIISTVIENSYMIEEIYAKLGEVPNPEEVEPDIHGYWIKRRVWEGRYGILRWLHQNFGDGV